MGELTIRVEDAKLLKALEQMALVHGTSVEDEVHRVLAQAVENHARQEDLIKRSRELRAKTPKGVRQTDSVEIIHEMREERDRALRG